LHVRNGEISVPFLADGAIKKKDPGMEHAKDFPAETIAEIKSITGAKTNEEVIEALSVCDGDKE
jgi:hypothetical protein